MKAGAICRIPNDIRIIEIEDYTVGAEDVIIKPKSIGLCATNVKAARYGHYSVDIKGLPFVEGHEVAGEVVEVGTEIKEFKAGDRVCVYIYVPCHNCYQCANGFPTMCERFVSDGIYPGGWAEYIKVSRKDDFSRRLYHLSDDVTYDEGALLEPLSCVVHSIEKADLRIGQSVVVIGAGFMGLLHTQLLAGYPLQKNISIDLSPYRLNIAQQMGATDILKNEGPDIIEKVFNLTQGKGADIVFEVTGNIKAYELAPRLAAKGGKIIYFGGTSGKQTMQIDPQAIHYKMLQLIGCQSAEDGHVVKAMKLINSKGIKLRELITHRFPMEKLKEAILFPQQSENLDKILKVVLDGFK